MMSTPYGLKNKRNMNKFRAFDTDSSTMFVPDQSGQIYPIFDKGVIKFMIDSNDGEGYPNERLEVELMQFTGQTDRNGKEIYQDDIVKSWNILDANGKTPTLCRVIWNVNCWHIRRLDGNRSQTGLIFSETAYGVVVVGNIWENPEYLNK